MTARCKLCNNSFRYQNRRGSKLSNYTCPCGGAYEIIGGSHYISGKHPFDPAKTYRDSEYYEGEYFNAEGNKKGQIFVFHEGKYHEIINPIHAKSKLSL